MTSLSSFSMIQQLAPQPAMPFRNCRFGIEADTANTKPQPSQVAQKTPPNSTNPKSNGSNPSNYNITHNQLLIGLTLLGVGVVIGSIFWLKEYLRKNPQPDALQTLVEEVLDVWFDWY